MIARLLERLLPAIYADPNRPRKCPVCGARFARADGVPTSHAESACSKACAADYDEQWAL